MAKRGEASQRGDQVSQNRNMPDGQCGTRKGVSPGEPVSGHARKGTGEGTQVGAGKTIGSPETRRKLRPEKFVALAFLLPLLGAILILPPLVLLPGGTASPLFGIPANIAYIFAVWLLLIAGAYTLQRLSPQLLDTPSPPARRASDD
ncbi:MAG TPA: hypothetical protein ENJ68_02055 [Devosia sp.]|nr:hypothetical protein [Devosia sp.]